MLQNELSFYNTICQIRTKEEVILYDELMTISEEELLKVAEFLEAEFKKEVNNHQDNSIEFDKNAAIWAAKITYFSWQLLLNRKNTFKEIEKYLEKYKRVINESAIISADLCLRFLPQVVLDLKQIDNDDPIVSVLNDILQEFPYSAIGYGIVSVEIFEQQLIKNSTNLTLLFLNRIVERRDFAFASSLYWKRQLQVFFGDYKETFWNEL